MPSADRAKPVCWVDWDVIFAVVVFSTSSVRCNYTSLRRNFPDKRSGIAPPGRCRWPDVASLAEEAQLDG